MSYQPKILLQLLNDVARKANINLTHAGIKTLAIEIDEYDDNSSITLTEDYLYETYRKTNVAIEQGMLTIKFNPNYINKIVQYLDIRDYNQYKEMLESKAKKEDKTNNQQLPKKDNSTYIGRNINKIEGDMNNGTINNN